MHCISVPILTVIAFAGNYGSCDGTRAVPLSNNEVNDTAGCAVTPIRLIP
jgi:hypothetical protein